MKKDTIEPEEKVEGKVERKHGNDDGEDFLKFLAEIIVEIIIKETSDGCNRIREEKHEGPV